MDTALLPWLQPVFYGNSPVSMATVPLLCSEGTVAVKKFVELVANGRLLECHAILVYSTRTIARRWWLSLKSCTASPTVTFFSAAVCARDLSNKRKFLKGISVALLPRVECRGVVKVTPQMFLSTDIVQSAYQAKL